MKWCLNSSQTKEYLKKAQEIKVPYKDNKKILDLGHNYPDATIILDLNTDMPVDWTIVTGNSKLAKDFICCCKNQEQMQKCKEAGIKFYYGYALTTFYDLNHLAKYGVCYVRLAPPLTHMLPKVKRFGVPIRMVPNIAFYAYFPREESWSGSWIRPENIDDYANFVDAMEFEDCDVKKEQALYRIYAEKKEWPGKLDMIITNLQEKTVVNRLINPEISKSRIDCGQRCQQLGTCHLCFNMFRAADESKIPEYQRIKNNKTQS